MHMKSNLRNFLLDQNFAINIYEEHIHVFGFIDIVKISDNNIILTMPQYTLNVKGSEFRVIQMQKQELLIKGKILETSFDYD